MNPSFLCIMTPSCSGALYFGKNKFAHEHCDKIILRKDFKPVWIHYKGIPRFWIYSLPMSVKITKTCRRNGTIKCFDLEIEGTGILYEEDNCQVFSEHFLLLSTASGYTNFTLTRGQVVVPELPDLLTEEETQVLVRHQDETDRTLGALDALMTRSFTRRQQSEVNFRELLDDLEHTHYEKNHYKWIIAAIAVTLILVISYVTSKFWRRPLLKLASRFGWQRPGKPRGLPRPKPRGARPCAMPEADEECELEDKPILPTASARTALLVATTTQQGRPDPKEDPKEKSEGPTITMTPMSEVRYSQPGRFQQV